MDTFEKARLKYEKNRTQQGRGLPKTLGQFYDEPEVEEVVAPKEKPPSATKHGVIECQVVLPDRTFKVTVTKRDIYSNVQSSKVNEANVKKCLIDGFRSLMGDVG